VIRKLLKWFIYVCLLLLAGVVTLILCKDIIIRNLTERRIIDQTGLYVRIDRLHVGVTDPVLSMQGFKLYNRPEFGGGLLLHLNDLHVEYDPESLQSGELHLNLFRLDLEELNIVRNAAGQTNIVDFIESAGTKGMESLSLNLAAKEFGFTGIDELDLSLGRIRFIDLGDPRRTREAYFGLKHEKIRNIRSEGDLYGVAGIVLLRSGLVNFGNAAPTPENKDPGSNGMLDLGWDWLMETMGLDRLTSPRPATNTDSAVRSSR
jgi:hypothetical protein